MTIAEMRQLLKTIANARESIAEVLDRVKIRRAKRAINTRAKTGCTNNRSLDRENN